MIDRIALLLSTRYGQGVVGAVSFREEARVIIEAMREPTEDMYVAWIENTQKVADAEPTGLDQLAACKSDWQAMIDAALGVSVERDTPI